ncbi:hypothetical protein L1987_07924 [Smallanthus sonchifolius]|uniref:Uncharacterized protein n=1 Tax=Smallanthus sonchifolius TaxID=185202 RepID=A0ACB9JKB5_9ASTR|nr:hypothetical protein L1987_07924 [Smallanthus sonchifolius]
MLNRHRLRKTHRCLDAKNNNNAKPPPFKKDVPPPPHQEGRKPEEVENLTFLFPPFTEEVDVLLFLHWTHTHVDQGEPSKQKEKKDPPHQEGRKLEEVRVMESLTFLFPPFTEEVGVLLFPHWTYTHVEQGEPSKQKENKDLPHQEGRKLEEVRVMEQGEPSKQKEKKDDLSVKSLPSNLTKMFEGIVSEE